MHLLRRSTPNLFFLPRNWKAVALLLLTTQLLIILDARRLIVNLFASTTTFGPQVPQTSDPIVIKFERQTAHDANTKVADDARFGHKWMHTEELDGIVKGLNEKCSHEIAPDVIDHRVGKERAIPRIVHQIWSYHTNTSTIPIRYQPWIKSWSIKNPAFYIRVFNGTTSQETRNYVTTHFPRPISEAFLRLPLLNQKAAFLKYLVLYKEGGVVADVDAECLRPIAEWKMGRKGVSVMFGKQWTKPQHENTLRSDLSLVTWSLSSISRHPLIHRIIQTITTEVLAKSITYLQDHPESVQHLFGASFLGATVEKYLSSKGVPRAGESWDNCGIGRQFLDVLVLGEKAFDARAFEENGITALKPLVRHHEDMAEWTEEQRVKELKSVKKDNDETTE
ncbi:hypothetical protein BC829DRAFT_51609 [Chytridium lagenaria]|nr:hypothetical protein BC829DRAFT_51609 [Chytridium lagenaria]